MPTKRNVQKAIASVFDPAGYLQPVVIMLKLLFQEICAAKVKWDTRLNVTLEEKWLKAVKCLKGYADMVIDRCYYFYDIDDPVKSVYLHGFSDASQVAFGACVYLKAVTNSGKVSVSLVTGKSRVAPIRKKITIPRLELLGKIYFGETNEGCSSDVIRRN